MRYPLIIGGNHDYKDLSQNSSRFYGDYKFQVSNAGSLDLGRAIGAARKADRSTLAERARRLGQAADNFSWSSEDLEHAVRMTGMPISLVAQVFEQIPQIFREVCGISSSRFTRLGAGDPHDSEVLQRNVFVSAFPEDGFCYAVTPGIDPRAAAMAAANLSYLGIPFILKASSRDASARLVIQALLESGFDPNFCSLVYFESQTSEASRKHHQILEASSAAWTFGPRNFVDQWLRYGSEELRAYLDLTGLQVNQPGEAAIRSSLAQESRREIAERVQFETRRADHFEGKIVLRHETGNCAAVMFGAFNEDIAEMLYSAIGYGISCSATKSIVVVDPKPDEGAWMAGVADYLAGLKAGDPLEADTQIGYIDERYLDWLEELVQNNRRRAKIYGGERLFRHQARPLLVASQEDLSDFFGQEISAYVLAVRNCHNLAESVAFLNKHSQVNPRLAVSFYHAPKDELIQAIPKIRAHAVMVDKPTTGLVPVFHDGNDYANLLRKKKLLII